MPLKSYLRKRRGSRRYRNSTEIEVKNIANYLMRYKEVSIGSWLIKPTNKWFGRDLQEYWMNNIFEVQGEINGQVKRKI